MDRTRRDTLLGAVFFGTLVLLLWATVNLTDLSLGRVPPITAYFPDAGGLRVGDPVLVLGKRVGKVGDVLYRPDRTTERIQVDIRLAEPVQLRSDYRIEIQESNLLGGKQVQIDPGHSPDPSTGELRGLTVGNPLTSVGGFFQGQGPGGEQLELVLQRMAAFFEHINDPDTSIGALVRRRDLYDEVLGTVQSLRRIFLSVEEGRGLLGRVVSDATLRDDAMRLIGNLAAVSDTLRGTDGTLPRLINDAELGRRLGDIVIDLNAIVAGAREGRGPLGRILVDETMATNLAEAVSRLNQLLQRANDPEAGAFGRLVADPDLGQSLKSTFDNLRQVTEKLNSGDGLLATLLNDRELAVRLRRIFTQVSRALEDAREAAPIGNFVQVLTGAF